MKRHWPILVILFIVFVFFARLFFPEPKLFYTSESLGTDLRANYYPSKDFLSKSFKKGELPFWTKDVGTGFPLFDEGQIGTFYIPNLLYLIFPTWVAWNLNYVLCFLLAFLGSYLFFRKLKISEYASLFSAFSFSFGGYFISRVIHTSPLQTISLTPWLFLVGERLWQKATKLNVLLFAFVLSQQIFAGGLQWVFISLIGVVIYLLAQFREKRGSELAKKIGLLVITVVFAFAIAAPQILPIWQLRQVSERKEGLGAEEIFFFPYSFKDFVTLVSPNYFGTPKEATYLIPKKIYWENTAYIGVLPLVFLLIAIVKRKRKNWEVSFLILGVFTLLLVPGKESPFHFLLTLPGFNNFRVPSRFLLLTTFSMAALAGSGMDRILDLLKGKSIKYLRFLVFVVIFALSLFDLFGFVWSYHPLITVSEALEAPKTASSIGEGERIFTHPEQVGVWREAFFKGGWQDTVPFVYFSNGLYANWNLVFDRTNVRAYAGLYPERYLKFYDLAPEMVDAASVEHIVTPVELLETNDFEKVSVITPPRDDLPNYYVYKNKSFLERFRFVSDYQVRKTIDEVVSTIELGNFPFEESVILEKDLGRSFEELTNAKVKVLLDEDQKTVLQTTTNEDALLVVADSFYPAWEATINEKQAEIMPANINQRAIVVPSGENTITFSYNPSEFQKGLKVTLVTLTIFALLTLISEARFLINKRQGKKAKPKE